MLQSLRNRFGGKFATVLTAGAAVAGLTLFSAPASAEFEEGAYELRVNGFAQNDVNFDAANISVGGQLGYFLTDQFEVGIRQDVTYTDIGESRWTGGTALFINYHFGEQGAEFQPFIGANIGYLYGSDEFNETFIAGPEGGVKYFVGEDWFIFGQIEYEFFFDDAGDADESFDDGTFNYRLGIGATL